MFRHSALAAFGGRAWVTDRTVRWQCAARLFWSVIILGLSSCGRDRVPPHADPEPSHPLEIAVPIEPRVSRDNSEEVMTSSVQVPEASSPRFRPEDRRVRHDETRLAELGIHVFESKRLKLYTDIDTDTARTLPPLIDESYLAWEDYFGPLPADREGTDFQMSGFVMRDMALFRGLGLIPSDLSFEHGSHLQNEFWMREQEFDYYRRHLLIHEATHCYMTYVPGVDAPRFYLEGMAEYFGTHRPLLPTEKQVDMDRTTKFCVMPTSREEFTGFGRILIIRKDVAAHRARTIRAVVGLESSEFVSPDPYAWSWALCAFLDGTPRYQERFRKLGLFTRGNQFRSEFNRMFGPDERDLVTEWNLFLNNLQYGYDLTRAGIKFQKGEVLSAETTERKVEIVADRGWQSSGVLMQQGASYELTAEGRFTLTTGDEKTNAWESEPQGISFRYFNGLPLGMLVGCLRLEDPRSDEQQGAAVDETMLKVISIGRGTSFVAPSNGTLYLRVNDAWNSLHDNHGHVTVRIVPGPAP